MAHAERFELTANQIAFIAALLTHATIEDAASAIGIHRRTAIRWMHDPRFKKAIRDAAQACTDQASRLLTAATVEAVTVLREIMKDKSIAPTARVSAARGLLDTSIKMRELDTLEERLTRLEELAGQGTSEHYLEDDAA